MPRLMSSVAVKLPPPELAGTLPVECCLARRRSCRVFEPVPLPLSSAAQLLWAAQGVTGLGGLRAAPSAGAVYPFHIYVIAMNIQGLSRGAYLYDADQHAVTLCKKGDLRGQLLSSVLDQSEVTDCAMAMVLAANLERMKREFGDAGIRLAYIEAGHIAENVFLQASGLGVGAIGLGRIDEALCAEAVDLPKREQAVYVLLTGVKCLT